MVIDTEKRRTALGFFTDFSAKRPASCRLSFSGDFLPEDSLSFSGTAAMAAISLSLSCADERLLKSNLEQLGYGDYASAGFDGDDPDRIGTALACRVANGTLETAVVLRGTEGREWYSNFDVGFMAEHRGFAKAADFAEHKLMDYIFTRAIGLEPRFFVCGYSRGAAAANILAKRLCDRYGTDRVRAYTVASPATTVSRRSARYDGIFNLVRQEDLFTRLPLSGWGYIRYGREIVLSGHGDISERFRTLTGEDYLGFTRQGPVDRALYALMTLAPHVQAYYGRRRTVGNKRLSLYEFMTDIADMLASEPDENAADIFMSAMVSDYADLMSFLSGGADLLELLSPSSAIPRCSVSDSHSPAAYMAALQLYLG